jgi:lipoprotein-anchoring transpeptidase ErfK/SrfK
MAHRTFILVAATLAILFAGAVALYAYDASNEDEIANGINVAGVDIGGLTTAEARQKLRERVSRPLEQKITVTARGKVFSLSAQDAGVRSDVGGMLEEARSRSRDGSIFARVLRDLTGGEEEDARIEPRVSYSSRAADELVGRVAKAMDRPAQDAKLNFPSLTQVKERDGVAIDRDALLADVRAALTSPDDRDVEAPMKVTKPKVTRSELASKYPKLLVVDRGAFKLRFYENLKLVKTYTIAVGQVGLETPAGLYNIQNKGVNVAWNVPNRDWAGSLAGKVIPGGAPNNPLKARWMGIYDGAGIHGTDQTASLGRAASKGCVRMAIPDVIELYDKVPVGAPIYIA